MLCARLFARVFSAPPWHEDWAPEKAREYLQKAVASPGFLGSVATEDGELLGAVFGGILESGMSKTCKIAEIFVEPEVQRRGVGSALLNHFSYRAVGVRATRLIATTLVDSSAAAFYHKHGFVSKGPVPYTPRKHTFEKFVISGEDGSIASGVAIPFDLREYVDSDAAAVWDLHVEGLNQTGRFVYKPLVDDDFRDIDAIYTANQGTFLVATVGEEVVGMGALRRVDCETAEVKRMRVRREYQGTRIGNADPGTACPGSDPVLLPQACPRHLHGSG